MTTDPLSDPETPEQAQARERAVLAARMDRAAIQELHGSVLGRHFLVSLFGWAGIAAPSGSPFREGQRDIGLRLLALLDSVDPMIYPELVHELAAEEVKRRQSAAERVPT